MGGDVRFTGSPPGLPHNLAMHCVARCASGGIIDALVGAGKENRALAKAELMRLESHVGILEIQPVWYPLVRMGEGDTNGCGYACAS